MTQPRRMLVSLGDTPYYHCISRCVRRAFLCGKDFTSGGDYEHRRQWVVDRLSLLEQVFAIDVCAYAIMSNHTHTVLRINRDQALALTEAEVVERWCTLFSRPPLVERYQSNESSCQAEIDAAREIIEKWRERLMDLGWFMRCLNEYIARKANREDGCTGRFWEGRFTSQALLDEPALLTCMTYVDLNPVRAGMAPTPEQSEYTSVLARIQELRGEPNKQAADTPRITLLPFKEAESLDAPDHLPFALLEYLQLVDWAGRAVRSGKTGYIPGSAPPILDRLGIDPQQYLSTMSRGGNRFGTAMGCVDSLKRAAERLRQRYIRGVGEAKLLFRLLPT